MVCNACMEQDTLTKDKALIDALGGPAKVADLLGFDKRGGVQRVCNWLERGIPAQIKVDHPKLFMPELAPKRKQKAGV